MNISSINLNLLVILDALFVERSVSRTARRVGLSQPAVSNALAQLRTLLGDPLFVRAPGGVVPTERALTLAGPVRSALSILDDALGARASFDPATSDRTFVIATTDLVEYVLLPKLLERIGRLAPRIRLQIRSWPYHRVPPNLETGELDLMIGFSRELPAGHLKQPLFQDQFVCVVRKGHPRVGKSLTLKTYLTLPHILVTEEANTLGVADIELAKRGLARQVALRLSHFLMVPSIVAVTDFVAALSDRVAYPFAKHLPLRVFPTPVPLPRGAIAQVWHKRSESSAAHQWLRETIAAVAQTV